jgi:hypothetical protein
MATGICVSESVRANPRDNRGATRIRDMADDMDGVDSAAS